MYIPKTVYYVPMKQIPTAKDIQAHLAYLSNGDIQKLAAASGVPFHTLRKIKSKETSNPGIDTVAKLWPALKKRKAATLDKAKKATQ